MRTSGALVLFIPDHRFPKLDLVAIRIHDPCKLSVCVRLRPRYDLDEMIAQLRAGGVEIVGGPESHENGKFAWVMDPDGNKVELWEPMLWDEKNKSA